MFTCLAVKTKIKHIINVLYFTVWNKTTFNYLRATEALYFCFIHFILRETWRRIHNHKKTTYKWYWAKAEKRGIERERKLKRRNGGKREKVEGNRVGWGVKLKRRSYEFPKLI